MTVSLTDYNSLGLNHSCRELVVVATLNELRAVLQRAKQANIATLILGGGSNIVLTDDFEGIVIKIALKGIAVDSDTSVTRLTVQAGEDWHGFVEFCLEHGFHGLENLALIPGSVGAAPIQNIGAYGVEVAHFCSRVDYLCIETGKVLSLSNAQCDFAYRESVFKQALRGKAVIVAVTFELPKKWLPNLSYGPLAHLSAEEVTPQQVFDIVCRTRVSKLPNPKDIGNVGSFFKNPVITQDEYIALQRLHSGIVGYPQPEGKVKVAAGWLIDRAGLKGWVKGRVGVHHNQALVLVNLGGATGADICALALDVIATVQQKFSITLEAEPRFIGAQGEVTLNDK